jgi:hypothetical protein
VALSAAVILATGLVCAIKLRRAPIRKSEVGKGA